MMAAQSILHPDPTGEFSETLSIAGITSAYLAPDGALGCCPTEGHINPIVILLLGIDAATRLLHGGFR